MRLDLGRVLDAVEVSASHVVLPVSGRTVDIRSFLREEVRSVTQTPRSASCWAPNKPALSFEGTTTWAEFVIVRLLERAGWDARWIRNWSGGRQICVDLYQQRALPDGPAAAFDALHRRAAQLRGAGSWDVFAWSGGDYLFLKSKQHRSDQLNSNQIVWLEAALDEGFTADHFAIVEYDAGPPVRASTGRAVPAARPSRAGRSEVIPAGLLTLLEAVRAADRSERIDFRNAVVEFGPAAIQPMTAWLNDLELRRFAIIVLEFIGRFEPKAVSSLRAFASASGPDATLAESAVERLKRAASVGAPRPSRQASCGQYVAHGKAPAPQGVCGIPNADGSACHNEGRHPVDTGWSCTTHFKALTRRGLARR